MARVFKKLWGRTVMITGASSGLGEQIAYEAAQSGAQLVLCARRGDKLKEVADTCCELSGQQVHTVILDIGEFDNCQRGLDFIKETIPTIDCLVNCAGMGVFETALETPFSVTNQMFQVNVLGLIHVTQQIALKMAETGYGHIINIASQAGKMATPKSSSYAASKFAVIGYSNSLRLELRPFNIAVTTVNPGPIETPFFDQADPSGDYLKQVAAFVIQPEDLAKKVVSKMGCYTREINTPLLMAMGSTTYQLFPHIGDYLARTVFNKK